MAMTASPKVCLDGRCAYGELVEYDTVGDKGWLSYHLIDGGYLHLVGDVIASCRD